MCIVLYRNSLTWLYASRKLQPSSLNLIVLIPVQSQSMGRCTAYYMKAYILFTFFLFVKFQSLVAQKFDRSICDSTIMAGAEFAKCTLDSVYDADIVMRVNYISFLKTQVLPYYRKSRLSISVPSELKEDLKLLRKIYDSTLTFKIDYYCRDMDRNQSYLQPKAYIASLLAFETLKFYPDVYAILQNPIHQQLTPKTTYAQQDQYRQLIEKVHKAIISLDNPSLWELVQSLERKKSSYKTPSLLFQGLQSEEERSVYEVVNFLLWTE